MNTVEPIKDMKMVLDVSDYLRNSESKYAERNYMLWASGIYLGLRISDILKLKVRDVRNKERIYIRETKTNKENYIEIPAKFMKDIKGFIEGRKDFEYLFSSRESTKIEDKPGHILKLNKPLTRQQAYNIIKGACAQFGINRIGTHTMRKTFGYFLYQRTKDIVMVQEVLNHSDLSVTKRYIGLTQDTKSKVLKQLDYGL